MWPFTRRKRDVQPTTEARQAQRTAEAGLRNELNRWPEVTGVRDSIKNAQLKNHLSEAMEQLIIRSGPRESRQ